MRKYLSKKEIKEIPGLLSPEELKQALRGYTIIMPDDIKVRVIDNRGNPLSPEKFSYFLSYTGVFGKERAVYYPHTVGFNSTR